MKKIAVVVALFAVGVGWLFLAPVKSNIATWRYKVVARSFDLMIKMSNFAEFLGLGPNYVFMRKFNSVIDSCPTEEGLKITEEKIGGVPALVFRPTADEKKTAARKPALVYFHGGGWTFNSPVTYCHVLTMIAKRLQTVVVAFDYRDGPEAPFPAAFDDCLAGLLAFAASAANFGVDASRIAVAGDSAGGNLALAVIAHLHSGAVKGTKFRAAQLGLIYPALQAMDFNLPSMHENTFEDMLRLDSLARYWQNYITGNSEAKWVPNMMNNSHASETTRQRAKELLWKFLNEKSPRTPDGPVDEAAVAALAPGTSDPLVSPILFSDKVFRQLPPVYLLSCEYDVLRDEAIVLSNRLKKLGHPLKHYHSMHYHAAIFFTKFGEPESVKIVEGFVAYLQNNL